MSKSNKELAVELTISILNQPSVLSNIQTIGDNKEIKFDISAILQSAYNSINALDKE